MDAAVWWTFIAGLLCIFALICGIAVAVLMDESDIDDKR